MMWTTLSTSMPPNWSASSFRIKLQANGVKEPHVDKIVSAIRARPTALPTAPLFVAPLSMVAEAATPQRQQQPLPATAESSPPASNAGTLSSAPTPPTAPAVATPRMENTFRTAADGSAPEQCIYLVICIILFN